MLSHSPMSTSSAAPPLLSATSYTASLLFGCPPRVQYQLAAPFLDSGYHYCSMSTLQNSLMPTITSLSIYLGESLSMKDLSTVSSVLHIITRRCQSIVECHILVRSGSWTQSSFLQLTIQSWFRRWYSPYLERQFRFIVRCPGLWIEVKTGRMGRESISTQAGIEVPQVNSETFPALSTFPELYSLSLDTPLPFYGRQVSSEERACATFAIIESIHKFTCLQRIVLPVDLATDLRPLLHCLSALPNLEDIELKKGLTLLQPRLLSVIALALTQGLWGFHHLKRLALPRELYMHDSALRRVVEGIEDLRYSSPGLILT